MPKEKLRQKPHAIKKRRQRRSTDEIVNLLIEAACEEFERNGYEKTKTAEIAHKAGVAEALIFSNFGSKAKLFHDSIFQPLDRLLLDFSSTHSVDISDSDSVKEGTREYVLKFQEFMGQHSRMLKSLVAAQMFESDNVKGMSQIEGLEAYFVKTAERLTNRPIGRPSIDPKLLTRISFATTLACVLFKDWLFPKGLASEERIKAAISSFVAEGINADFVSIPKTKRSGRSLRSSSKGQSTGPAKSIKKH